MSEENSETPKITTVKKEKDSKRVEAGKRLAQISKQGKENKMRQKIESDKQNNDDENGWNLNYGFLIGSIGVAVAIGSLYYAKRLRETTKDKLKNKRKIRNLY